MAFAIAAIIGAAVFLIWWLTSDARLRRNRDVDRAEAASAPAAPPPSREAIIESALPRGGALTGSTDVMPLAAGRLTGAPLVRGNRSTGQAEPGLAQSRAGSGDHLI